MDIREELINIESNNSSSNKYIQDIEAQKYELSKKAHLLKMIAFSNAIEELTKTDLFIDNGVEFLEISWERSSPSSIHNIRLCFCILDKEKKGMPALKDQTFVLPFSTLMKETDKLGMFDYEFIKNGALTFFTKELTIEAKPGIKDFLLDILLSDDLKVILNYNRMQLELPNNSSCSKKLKV